MYFNKQVFVVHITTITSKIAIYLAWQAQIALSKVKKALIIVPKKYLDYTNIFPEKLNAMLLEQIKIKIHAINPKKHKQPLYRPLYSLRPVKLETVKTYIKTNLVNNFIHLAKFPISTSILFNPKSDKSF